MTTTDCCSRPRLVGQLKPPHGALAEYAVAPTANVISIPDAPSDAQALGIGRAGTTAWLALTWKGQREPGQSVLVTAATGAVGQVAVQAAKAPGATRVVAAGRHRPSLEFLREHGADETIVIDDDFSDRLAEVAGDEFDLVLDGLFGDHLSLLI